MPELPEAEHARARIARWLGRRALTDARAIDGLVVRNVDGSAMSPAAFLHALVGARVRGARRRGKRVVVDLDRGRALGFTLGMSGRPVLLELGRGGVLADASVLPPHTRWAVAAGRRAIALVDPRRFSRATVGERAAVERFLGLDALGPEPATVTTGDELGAILERARGPIQAALMDQRKLAGLGNIHAAEALFLARIRPTRAARSLGSGEREALARGIHQALARAVIPPGEELRYASEGGPRPFLVYGRAGEPCPRCGATIARARGAGRSWYFCPSCQPAAATPMAGARKATAGAPRRR